MIDRLEAALRRIAFTLDQKDLNSRTAGADLPEADAKALAAKLDALCTRIRGILEQNEKG